MGNSVKFNLYRFCFSASVEVVSLANVVNTALNAKEGLVKSSSLILPVVMLLIVIARCLISPASIRILDEPTAALDPIA